MNFNQANGGLAVKAGGKLFLSDIRSYADTVMLDLETGQRATVEGVCWFMNVDGSSVYYSDQQRGNALCRLDLNTQTAELLLDIPGYGLLLFGDWLYYTNESDRKLYRSLLNGKSEEKLTEEQVTCFFVEGDVIYYTTPQGIRRCGLNGARRETVTDKAAAGMVKIGNKLAFADQGKQYALTLLDLTDGTTELFEHIAPCSLNTDGRYLYCSNRKNDRTVYRIDPEQGSSIRICGESAEYLHIIEDQIYFCGRDDWFRMPLLGGQPVKATTLP